MLSLTPTKLRDYLTCPQMYKLRHIGKVDTSMNSVALAFGRSLHAALEELHKSSDGNAKARIDPEQLLLRHWERGAYIDKLECETYFAKGCDALRRYVETSLSSAERLLGTEVFMSHVVNIKGLRIKFGCKADRVTVMPDGALEVLDYKTNFSGRLPTPESLTADLPTFLYYLLARVFYPDYKTIRISQLNVLTLTKVEIEYDQNQVTGNKRSLIVLARSFEANAFDPRPSEACAWCPVQDHCPLYNKEVDLDSI